MAIAYCVKLVNEILETILCQAADLSLNGAQKDSIHRILSNGSIVWILSSDQNGVIMIVSIVE